MNEMNELMQVVRQSAFNIQSVSEQMGVVAREVKDLKLQQLRLSEKMDSLDTRLQNHERTERVNRAESQNIRRSIHLRVNELLDIKFKDGVVAEESLEDDIKYRGGFISRCYHDARTYSKLGTPYSETLSIDYLETMNYIGSWVPVCGVTGYKEYLDKRAEEAEKNPKPKKRRRRT